MYNGHKYLSCIKIPATKQAMTKFAHKSEEAELMDLAAEHRNLISAANKVFGEGKWSHTVVSQTLDFVNIIGAKCCAGCVSFVKVQLENGNFHEDVGYYSAEESTKGLSIYNARIGSAVNALKRVLLSFGDKIERELQQLQNPGQANDVQRDVSQSLNKQTSEISDVSLTTLTNTATPLLGGQCSVKYREVQSVKIVESSLNKTNSISEQKSISDPILISTLNNDTAGADTLPPVKIQSAKIVEPSSDKTNSTSEQNSKLALSTSDMLRMERKRLQMEKQMEFKRRMMEQEGLMSAGDNKPNPRY